MKIKVGISNRHIHLCKEDAEILFGKDYVFKKRNDLSEPGEYACEETVMVSTDKHIFDHVRVLGPLRDYTQVEVSRDDATLLGINPPVRNSGDLSGSCCVTLIGTKGEITIEEGVIIATRHIHLSEEHIKKYNLDKNKTVSIKINGEKGGILNNVYLKVLPNSYLELHLDTDDANAHLINNGDIVEVIYER